MSDPRPERENQSQLSSPSSRRRVVYVARYDVPAHDVKAGQVFRSLDEIPVNVAVTPKFPDP